MQAGLREARFDEIARRDNRIQECIGKGFLACGRRQVKDERHVLGGSGTILARQEIARGDHCSHAIVTVASEAFEARRFTAGADKTSHVAESTVEQTVYESCSDEAGSPGYQDWIVRLDRWSVVYHLTRICRRSASR